MSLPDRLWPRCGRAVRGPALLVALGAACYNSTALGTTTPAPGTPVALELSDQGRVGVGVELGPSLDRIEGTVVGVTDSTYLLRVARVTDVRGVPAAWGGETVAVSRAWVGRAYERRFSRSRTYLVAGAVTAALVAFIATRGFGLGGPVLQNPGGGGGGSTQ